MLKVLGGLCLNSAGPLSLTCFPLAYHFVAGPGSLTLELGELSPVVDGDEQLPDDQKRKPSQEDAADHGQEDGHGTGGGPTLWRNRAQ